jgi:uncharacterized cupredoxin-like copper-binding protein
VTDPTEDQIRPPFAQIAAGAAAFVVVVGLAAVGAVMVSHYVDQHDKDSAAAAAAALAADSTVDVSLTEWAVIAKPSAPAGDVTFNVTNDGTMEHEMVVLQTDTMAGDLPVDNAGDPPAPVTSGADKVSEDANIGETGDPELLPGDTRSFIVAGMAPGHYVLICNLGGHYTSGMHTDFTVTG